MRSRQKIWDEDNIQQSISYNSFLQNVENANFVLGVFEKGDIKVLKSKYGIVAKDALETNDILHMFCWILANSVCKDINYFNQALKDELYESIVNIMKKHSVGGLNASDIYEEIE